MGIAAAQAGAEHGFCRLATVMATVQLCTALVRACVVMCLCGYVPVWFVPVVMAMLSMSDPKILCVVHDVSDELGRSSRLLAAGKLAGMCVGIRVALGVWFVGVFFGCGHMHECKCVYEQECTPFHSLLFSRLHPAASHVVRPTAAAAALYHWESLKAALSRAMSEVVCLAYWLLCCSARALPVLHMWVGV